MFICKSFFLVRAQDQIFDAVLVQQGHEQLVSRGRNITTGNGAKKLGSALTKPLNRFSKEGLIRYVISLPLNALPVVGTALFLLYNGKKSGPTFHARYFQLKDYDVSRRRAFIERRQGAYIAFGVVAMALNLVPVVGLLFTMTSTAGAAIWASSLERKASSSSSGHVVPVPEENEVRVEL